MEIRLTVTAQSRGGRPADVVVSAPPGVPLHAVAGELCRAAGATGDLWCDDTPLPAGAPLGEPPLVSGAVVAVVPAAGRAAAPPTSPPGPPESIQLHVVSGPDAGAVHLLGYGNVCIGRGRAAGIRIDDPDISRRHAELTVTPGGVTVRDLGSTNGSAVDGEVLDAAPTPLPPGAMLRLGETLLTPVVDREADATVAPDGAGRIAVNRPPRLTRPLPPVEVHLPAQPRAREAIRFPLIAMLLPMVLALPMTFLLGPQLLAFLLLSPLMVAGNYLGDRVWGRRAYDGQLRAHQQAEAAARAQIDQALADEVRRRRCDAPDPATLLLSALGPRPRLWERRRADDDALSLRLGVASLPSRIRVRGPTGDPAAPGADQPLTPTAADVPVTVSLRTAGVVGIAGSRHRIEGLSRALVAQLAGLHSPRDLELVLLCTPASAQAWRWAQWLPHLRAGTGHDCMLLLGLDESQASARVAELVAQLDARFSGMDRRDMGRPGMGGPGMGGPGMSGPVMDRRGTGWTGRYTVIVMDGSRQLRALPGVVRLLEDGPRVGIHSICLADVATALPAECRATVVLHGDVHTRLRLSVAGEGPVADGVADLVSQPWVERFARALAPLRDATSDGGETPLPSAVRLLDLLRLDPPSPEAIVARWRAGGRSTSAVLGVGLDGTFAVDLRRDGPHGLVAGTTGAGKSELLQTLIASLAVANRPDELCFVLVDYKGGAAFSDCGELPHTVGLVTDLDAQLTERALRSLDAELKRRERLLRDSAAKDIEDYQAAGPARRPLPRLLIIIDEFASLVQELPDFVAGVVDVARRGRSLGVHLVLATQRPGGVVSAQIRANTNLRIGLRVTDPAESQDVIESKDAALISQATPGRAYVRTGAGTPTPVQCAQVSGRKHPEPRVAPSVRPVRWETLGDPRPRRPGGGAEADGPTDLGLLVQAVRGAAASLGVAPAPSPWLPPLPDRVCLTKIPAPLAGAARVPVGLVDVPSRQAQEPFAIDLEGGGHWLVAGGPRSGRSTMLRTLAGAVARDCAVADVHLYGLDCGSGALQVLTALPHCGAVATRDQAERGERIISRLGAEVARRQRVLGECGFSSVAEQRAAVPAGQQLPWLLLLIDGWEGFLSAYEAIDHGRVVESLLQLLREGAAAGLRAVITGDRGLLTGRASSLLQGRLVLRMSDRMDFALAGVSPHEVPGHLPPGRALLPMAGAGREVQLAVLGADPAGPAQVAQLHRLGAARARDPDLHQQQRPFQVRELPGQVPWSDVLPEALRLAGERGPLWTLVGIGGDELGPCGVDMAENGPAFVVAGPPRSGRSTTLLSLARWYVTRGVAVAAVTPGRSPLRDLAGTSGRSPLRDLAGMPGVVGHFGVTQPDAAALTALLHALDRRPVAVLVDDAERVLDSPVEAVLLGLLRAGPADQRAVVVAGAAEQLSSTYRGLAAEARKGRCGLLLSPTGPLDGDLLGVRVTPARQVCPGRGVLAASGMATPVQVPFP